MITPFAKLREQGFKSYDTGVDPHLAARSLQNKGLVDIRVFPRSSGELSDLLVTVTQEGKMVLGAYYSMRLDSIPQELVDAHRRES